MAVKGSDFTESVSANLSAIEPFLEPEGHGAYRRLLDNFLTKPFQLSAAFLNLADLFDQNCGASSCQPTLLIPIWWQLQDSKMSEDSALHPP